MKRQKIYDYIDDVLGSPNYFSYPVYVYNLVTLYIMSNDRSFG